MIDIKPIPEQLVEWAGDHAGLDSDNIRFGYSGRFMYGRTCLGLVYDNPGEVTRFVVALRDEIAKEGDEALAEEVYETMLNGQSGDQMGLSSIAYWRGIKVEGYVREARS